MGNLVSVIVPCFNGERWIGQALQSVCAQTYPHWELIVINDGSTDGSEAVINAFTDPRIRQIKQTNRGLSKVRKRGVQEANGKFIAFLDYDDLWHAEKLSRQVTYLDAHPEVGVVYTNAHHIDAEGHVIGRRYGTPPGKGWLLERFLRAGVAVAINSTLIRHSSLDMVDPINDRLYGCDDFDLLVRLASRFPFGYIDECLVQLRYHDTNMSWNEEMCLDQFILADEFTLRFPQYPKLVRRFRAQAHCNYGRYLMRKGERRGARDEFQRAMQTDFRLWRSALMGWFRTVWTSGTLRMK